MYMYTLAIYKMFSCICNTFYTWICAETTAEKTKKKTNKQTV